MLVSKRLGVEVDNWVLFVSRVGFEHFEPIIFVVVIEGDCLGVLVNWVGDSEVLLKIGIVHSRKKVFF